MQNGESGVQRRRKDLEAGVTVTPSAVHGRRDDLEAGMEAGVAVVPSSALVSPRTAVAFEKIDAMYEDA